MIFARLLNEAVAIEIPSFDFCSASPILGESAAKVAEAAHLLNFFPVKVDITVWWRTAF